MYRWRLVGGVHMEVINCKECGRLFNAFTRSRLCPECQTNLEKKFQEVKEYIYKNPGSLIDRVSKDCDVSTKQIKQWVREERLTFSEESMQGVECEKCGILIRSGRFCVECKAKLENDLKSATRKPVIEEKKTIKDRDRMRFLQEL